MISFLSKLFIKDKENTNMPSVRKSYGVLCGAVGIFFNILLFVGKLIAGILSGSIAIISDAFNNLSDAGSSIITLIGFRLAGQKPDPEHPYGHGRIEYIAGLIVSIIIIVVGIELGKSSIEKIINPQEVEFNLLSMIILIASIFVKLYMGLYNRKYSKKINSASMRAVSFDSFCDCLATLFVLITMLVEKFTDINIDGYSGLFVALFILYAGFSAARETITPLIGKPPEENFIRQIKEIVLAHEEVTGIHDLIVHDYGLGHVMISLHAEVSSKANLLHIHDDIDEIEQELYKELNCDTIIHIDPIVTENEKIIATQKMIEEKLMDIDNNISIHDFRMVKEDTYTNVVFDMAVPFEFEFEEDVKEQITSYILSLDPSYKVTVRIDKS